jgi:hypothetical protein
MFGKPSLMTRIAVGKLVGFIFGLLAFICIPFFLPDASAHLRWGFLLWYTTVGAVIGMFGVVDRHPMFNMSLKWWFRGPWIGAWMNFTVSLLAYDQFKALMTGFFGPEGMFTSPFWFALEGAIVGLIIGYLATRFGGEGPETAGK